jgi:hypothetical protein
MNDRNLKLWGIIGVSVSLILSILIFIWLFKINPLDKDVFTPLVPGICLVFTTYYLLINFIPSSKKRKVLWIIIASVLLPIAFGVLYFFIL